jgi:hypothetical protein
MKITTEEKALLKTEPQLWQIYVDAQNSCSSIWFEFVATKQQRDEAKSFCVKAYMAWKMSTIPCDTIPTA